VYHIVRLVTGNLVGIDSKLEYTRPRLTSSWYISLVYSSHYYQAVPSGYPTPYQFCGVPSRKFQGEHHLPKNICRKYQASGGDPNEMLQGEQGRSLVVDNHSRIPRR